MNQYIICLLKAHSTKVYTKSAMEKEQIEDSKRDRREMESLRASLTEDVVLE